MLFKLVLGAKAASFLQVSRQLSGALSKVRCFCQHEIIRSKRAEFRMSRNVFRQEKFYKATVEDIFHASPSIKVLRLLVGETEFSFKAGQWVDFYVPGMEDVTGYSMTSAPYLAEEKGILELAVKYGKFPPTHWVHTNCKVGMEVVVQVGGDFYYDPQPGFEAVDLLLVGGGVGINPLISILLEYCHILDSTNSLIQPGNVCLLFSASTEKELIFRENLTQMVNEHPSLSCRFFVTRSSCPSDDEEITWRRIHEGDITDALEKLQKNIECYICGPSTMTDDVANMLLNLGIEKNSIKYEKWW